MSPAGAEGGFASVALPVPLRREFTYRVSASLAVRISLGSRVRVPFGKRKLTGTVVEWPSEPPPPSVVIKSILELAAQPAVTAQVLELTRFVADYYLSSWGEAIETALPPEPGEARPELAVRRIAGADGSSISPRAAARERLWRRLPQDGSPLSFAALDAGQRSAARALVQLGLVEIVKQFAPEQPKLDAEEGPPPTTAQRRVLDELMPAIEAGGYATCLLFGATGSGKTEVYMRAARKALDLGRGVLWLVPEIGLTPLLVGKIERRFPGQVALLHSALGKRQRHDAWRRVRDGDARLVLGTRSAIFSPVAELGLIVVDEEQDGSYKQAEAPRYNARDLATLRGREEGALVLLGSATPACETFHHARSGRYRLLRLGGRVHRRPLPEVTIVDMRQEYERAGEVTPLSRPLLEALARTVGRGEQALVLRNRRGWAAALLCTTCGTRVTCDACSVAMTWHRSLRRLRCHYCDRSAGFPSRCPTCRAESMTLHGEGSERVESLLQEALPGAIVARMDRDSVRGRGAHARMLERFDRGEIDVLVGTQMIAKGHDFHRVTLVGVLSADQALGLPDFRAGERVFHLLTQVAGRAGRGDRPGSVLIQAFDPEHPLLRQAAGQDYEAFFEHEAQYRRTLRYPPFAALVQLIVSDADALKARLWAAAVADELRASGDSGLLVSGPGPAPLERLHGRFRQQILVRAAGRRRLIDSVAKALENSSRRAPRRSIQVDVDPYNLL